MVRFRFLVFVVVLAVARSAFAQSAAPPVEDPNAPQGDLGAPVDYALPLPHPSVYRYLIPVAGVLGVNFICWAFSKYAMHAPYADISWDTIKANFEHGFVFDQDGFSTNEFSHPYQGSMYYNTARSTGLGFWPSALFTLFGSWQWEMFMENEYPSTNDIITTSIGGSTLGEVLFRLSSAVLDDSTSGTNRAFREFFGLALSPIHGIERLITGSMWKKGPPPIPPLLSGELDLGAAFFSKDVEGSIASFLMRLEVDYGVDITRLKKRFKPFDSFTFGCSGMVAKEGLFGGSLSMTGLTNGWKFSWAGSDNAAFGLAMDYNYFNTDFDVGTSGLGPAVLATFPVGKEWNLNLRFLLAGVFGGISSPHPDDPERSYNFGAGPSADVWVQLVHPRYGKAYLRVRRDCLFIVSGADGTEMAGIFYAGATWKIVGPLGAGGRFFVMDGHALYNDYANVNGAVLGGEAYLSYCF